MDLLEDKILEYEAKGFHKIHKNKLRHGLRIYLKKDRGWGRYDGIYLYYVDGKASDDSILECLKDYAKFYQDNSFDKGDKGFFLSSSIDEERFKKIKRAKIEDVDVRNSIKSLVLKRTDERTAKEGKPERADEKRYKIFVVHGRDRTPAVELARLLEREFKLEPILLQEQPHSGRTLTEKLDDYSNVAYAFVIVTPDDIGGLKGEELRERPRQNVVLEWGLFRAKIGKNKTCILLKGNMELPSDMGGVGFHRFNDSVEEVFLKVKRELKDAGLID
jgi:predicted nucleotide-binding protein